MAELTAVSRCLAIGALAWLAAAARADQLPPPPLQGASQAPSDAAIPKAGSARGGTTSNAATQGESAEALEEQAKVKMRAGQYEEALALLKRAKRSTLDPSLEAELNSLTLEAEALRDEPSQPQARQPPQKSMQEQFDDYMRHEAAKRQAYRNGATLDPDLVGTWVSDPAYPMVGGRLTLTIGSDGVYTWVQGNTHDTGKIQAMNTRVTMITAAGKRLNGAFRILSLAPSTSGPGEARLQLAFFSGRQFFLTRRQ